jgi:hypothetical protein
MEELADMPFDEVDLFLASLDVLKSNFASSKWDGWLTAIFSFHQTTFETAAPSPPVKIARISAM